jgi:hypothetical protein
MSPAVETVMFIMGCSVWGVLIVLGMSPVLGARVGLWLRGLGGDRNVIEKQSWRAWPGDRDGVQDRSDEGPDKHVGKNLDRFV